MDRSLEKFVWHGLSFPLEQLNLLAQALRNLLRLKALDDPV